MGSNSTYMIRFMQYKNLKSFNLTQIDVKTLVMNLTFILSLILGLRDKKKRQKSLSTKEETYISERLRTFEP